MDILYRNAKKEDSVRLAELDSIAAGGAIEYLFHDLVPNMTPIEIVAANFYNDSYPHSYRCATVAEYQGQVVGMSLSFPGSYHKITDEMVKFFPKERIEHFKEFFSVPVDNGYFLDAISVEEKFRQMGIGEKLIELTEQKAKNEGYNVIGLLVWRDNVKAIKFYEKVGFKAIRAVSLHPHEMMPHEGGCLLMEKPGAINVIKET